MVLLMVPAMALFSCAGRRPADLGVQDGQLRPCPSSPNCVCSEDTDSQHGIAPLRFTGDPAAAFASGMLPNGATNLTGIDDPELTAAVNELKAADGVDAQKEALTRLQEVFNEVQPFTVMANAEQYVTVSDTVGGLTPTLSSTVLYDGAYVQE